ncbi:hypothetical protein RF11_04158 [Thelohanellus kitauei]|uniref:Uncharacterized protein n=1 Tax=Thelohanellus kitauei TaxID=669202 RepID=A0A0C2NCJ7_THEKT|nr:hypothetical protein RF11_04158 [Thelohanellus kitauei]
MFELILLYIIGFSDYKEEPTVVDVIDLAATTPVANQDESKTKDLPRTSGDKTSTPGQLVRAPRQPPEKSDDAPYIFDKNYKSSSWYPLRDYEKTILEKALERSDRKDLKEYPPTMVAFTIVDGQFVIVYEVKKPDGKVLYPMVTLIEKGQTFGSPWKPKLLKADDMKPF